MALTPKQQRFCEEYLIDLNATQAAIRAGYATKRASEQAYQLLQNTTVQEFIQGKADKRSESVSITAEDVLQSIKDIRDEARVDKKNMDALKANELLGKHLKLFTEKTEVTGANGGAISVSIERVIVDSPSDTNS